MPHKMCHNCATRTCKEEYSDADWRARGDECCKACFRDMEEAGTLFCVLVVTGGKRMMDTQRTSSSASANAFVKTVQEQRHARAVGAVRN